MSLLIDFDGLWDGGSETRVESALRECIGQPPGDEEWSVAVTSYGSYCMVFVKTAQQTRRKMFFLSASELAEALPVWLKQYPLR
jgi:hypothetical protein